MVSPFHSGALALRLLNHNHETALAQEVGALVFEIAGEGEKPAKFT
jgi:hypothetical protein